MTLGTFEFTDSASVYKPAAADSLINSIDLSDLGSGSNNSATDSSISSLPDVSVSEAQPVALQTIEPYFLGVGEVNITTAAENQANGVEPDYFIGEDGQLIQNPDKDIIASDGNLNIQLKSPDDEAAKAANEAQKATVQELIRYYQKYNPGKPTPQEWLDKLYAQPGKPAGNNNSYQSSPQNNYRPASNGSRNYSPSGGRRSSGRSTGYRPGGGNRSIDRPGSSRGFDAQPIGPRGNIERHPPMAGDMRLDGPPTITPEKIDEVLKSYGSPATGLGQVIYDEGVKSGINPAVALAFFIQESSAGTAGIARHTKSWGNIRGKGPAGSYKGFRAYNTYEEGVKDWYRLIDDKYLAPRSEGGRGYETLSQVIRTYAPSSDNNNEQAYVANVKGMVDGWARTSGVNANIA